MGRECGPSGWLYAAVFATASTAIGAAVAAALARRTFAAGLAALNFGAGAAFAGFVTGLALVSFALGRLYQRSGEQRRLVLTLPLRQSGSTSDSCQARRVPVGKRTQASSCAV